MYVVASIRFTKAFCDVQEQSDPTRTRSRRKEQVVVVEVIYFKLGGHWGVKRRCIRAERSICACASAWRVEGGGRAVQARPADGGQAEGMRMAMCCEQ